MTTVHENDPQQEDRITPEQVAMIRESSEQQQVDMAAILAHRSPVSYVTPVVGGTASSPSCPSWCTRDHLATVRELVAQYQTDVVDRPADVETLSSTLAIDTIDSLDWHEHLVIDNEVLTATIEETADDELGVTVVIGATDVTLSEFAAREVAKQVDWAADLIREFKAGAA